MCIYMYMYSMYIYIYTYIYMYTCVTRCFRILLQSIFTLWLSISSNYFQHVQSVWSWIINHHLKWWLQWLRNYNIQGPVTHSDPQWPTSHSSHRAAVRACFLQRSLRANAQKKKVPMLRVGACHCMEIHPSSMVSFLFTKAPSIS